MFSSACSQIQGSVQLNSESTVAAWVKGRSVLCCFTVRHKKKIRPWMSRNKHLNVSYLLTPFPCADTLPPPSSTHLFPSEMQTAAASCLITYMAAAKPSSLCGAGTAGEALGGCVCYNHRASCPSPGRKLKQATRVDVMSAFQTRTSALSVTCTINKTVCLRGSVEPSCTSHSPRKL